MKRLFALVLSFCMALSIGVCAAAETPLRENENGVLLSSLDYEECRNFLLNQGVSIPEELSGIDLPKLFADLESNPDMVVSLGWTTLADFIEEVRFVVKSHYACARFQKNLAACNSTWSFITTNLTNPRTRHINGRMPFDTLATFRLVHSEVVSAVGRTFSP